MMKEIEGSYAVFGDGKMRFIPDALLPAIEGLVETYKIAVTLKYVQKPVAYAIYQVWLAEAQKKAGKGE